MAGLQYACHGEKTFPDAADQLTFYALECAFKFPISASLVLEPEFGSDSRFRPVIFCADSNAAAGNGLSKDEAADAVLS